MDKVRESHQWHFFEKSEPEHNSRGLAIDTVNYILNIINKSNEIIIKNHDIFEKKSSIYGTHRKKSSSLWIPFGPRE